MAKQDRTSLKGFFETGDVPTQSQFEDLIDSYINRKDDEIDKSVDSIGSLISLDFDEIQDGAIVYVRGFYSSVNTGAGTYKKVSGEDKQNHNGWSVIDPDHTATVGDINNWYDPENTGNGCWVLKESLFKTAQDLGGETLDQDNTFDVADYFTKVLENDDVLFINGRYRLTPDSFSTGGFNGNAILGKVQGSGSGIYPLDSSTGTLLPIGDASSVSLDSKIADFRIDLNEVTGLNGLKFLNSNHIHLNNLRFVDLGDNGKAIWNDATDTPELMQDIYVHQIGINSSGSIPSNSYGFYIEPTGNFEISQSVIENIGTAIYARYKRNSKLSVKDSQIERCMWFLDVDNCRVSADVQISDGGVWLGSGVWGSDITMERNNVATNIRDGIVDNGIGNKITVNGSADNTDISDTVSGIEFSGDEWFFADNIDSDPKFKEEGASWTTTNSSIEVSRVNTSGLGNNNSLLIAASAADGYIEKSYTVDTAKEYMFQAGFTYFSSENDNVRVEFYDGTDTLIYNSGTLTKWRDQTNGELKFIYRKWLPENSTGTLKVRVYVENNGDRALMNFVTLNESQNTIDDITGEDSITGTGANQVINVDLQNELVIDTGTDLDGAALVRFIADVDAGAYFSAFRSQEQAPAYSIVNLFQEEREYVVLLPDYNSRLEFRGSANATIKDVSIHRVPYDKSLSTIGGSVEGDTEFTGDHTQTGNQTVTGTRSNTGLLVQNDQSTSLGNIGTNGSTSTLITADLSTGDCSIAIDIEVVASGSEQYIGKALIRKSSGAITDKVVNEQLNTGSTFTITLNEVDSSTVEVNIDNSNADAFATGFYHIKTFNSVTVS